MVGACRVSVLIEKPIGVNAAQANDISDGQFSAILTHAGASQTSLHTTILNDTPGTAAIATLATLDLIRRQLGIVFPGD